ncbi:DUF4468 domain-containing protein [Croceitalea marina]|uniref:DUF4468 domain-containing protein n=1 Tax=Croceitalea marina TaxID=1775166 RepID=A0ABW5MVL5_9FLAO|tara:strand:- start:11 stop:682 length:672 start_codon:yes stop_codon:yes gene_type:complete
MKKTNLIFGIILVLMTSLNCNAQEYEQEEKTISGIFDIEGKSKTEIFASINKWIALNYNSAQNVVQLNDKESGNIIVKGINEAVYKNVMKELYPKNKYMQEFSTVEFNHTMEINIKDNKFRIIYTLTDIITPAPVAGYNLESQYNMVFEMIDFTGLKQEKIDNYNNYIEELWKKAMVGKKKREKFKEMTKPTFEEMNKGVIESIKSTMISIEKAVKSTKKDDW